MAKCSKCSNAAAVTAGRLLCASHFIQYFERKVLSTIKKFNLISKNDRIMVASSGGKDSTTLLYILKKYFGSVEALAIDEGIPGYRNVTLDSLKKFCRSNSIPIHIYSYKKEFGFTLSDAIKANREIPPCNMCGILRRYLLNKKSAGFTKVATGHNLDDEAQSIMMNLIKSQTTLLSRLGPMTGVISDKKFVKRIKPLYLCTEKEVASYAIIKKLMPQFMQCPYAHTSLRAFIRDTLNDYEQSHKGAKLNLVVNFLRMLPQLKCQNFPSIYNRWLAKSTPVQESSEHAQEPPDKNSIINIPSVSDGWFLTKHQEKMKLRHCESCGEPSSKELCKACKTINEIRKHLYSARR